MRTPVIGIRGAQPDLPTHAAPSPRIAAEHRSLVLVQRDADGSIHPLQGGDYSEAMAQSIERCARDIQRGEDASFEALWSRASNTLSSFFLGRRGLSLMRRATRSQTDLHAAARSINELEPVPFATAHAEHGATRPHFIEPRILRLADELMQRGQFDAQQQSWTRSDYRLSREPLLRTQLLFHPGAELFVLCIDTPRLLPHQPDTQVQWRLDSADGDQPTHLSHRLFRHENCAHPGYREALHAHINRLLQQVLQTRQLPQRLRCAHEAYWWMLHQIQEAVGDKAQLVMQSVLLATGHDLPPSPCGIDPALEALSRSLPDWLDHAPHIWGHGVGPRDLVQREMSGVFSRPASKRGLTVQASVELDLLGSSPTTRRRRAQIEADFQAFQANLKIA